ncbi:hypothetical protein PG985_004342 [Apiospora marii]|uniref:uncharacterized protein n=1 Tax=Apiospora marii TaxID=335849 RepID=UPI00312DB130
MSLRNLGSKLTTSLRATYSSCHPDPDAMALDLHTQSNSALMRLPLEIRDAILKESWMGAGVSQHLVVRNGHLQHATCVCDHAASDGLTELCFQRGPIRFEDGEVWGRMRSTWGNHWKCEEEFGRSTAGTNGSQDGKVCRSPFLAIMLTCKQLYLECRISMYTLLCFVIHDLDTLRQVVTGKRPLIASIRNLNLAIRLPIKYERQAMARWATQYTMGLWKECCVALDHAAKEYNLVSVDLWLDTVKPSWRGILSSIPKDPVNPFCFGERLAAILTVDLPVNPDRPEVWQSVSDIQPQFTVRARGWPPFRSEDSTESMPHTIIRLQEHEEPGSVQPELIIPRTHVHRVPLRRVLFDMLLP